jgi:hypothetical protein
MNLAKLPDGTTQQQLTEFITAFEMGTPTSVLDPSQIIDIGGISTLSPGQTTWTAYDLEPGVYGVACFFPDNGTGAPHAVLGMAVLFTVQ